VPRDARRERVAEICLDLPGVTRRGGQHDKFSVRGRTVAYYLDDHHGDGRRAINCKAPPGMRDRLVEMGPERYYVPPYLGPKGWIGFYLDGRSVDWDEVTELIADSYRLVAPKGLVARLDDEPRARPRPRRRRR
jgi:phosphoribosylglycinamide formyltransferase-1